MYCKEHSSAPQEALNKTMTPRKTFCSAIFFLEWVLSQIGMRLVIHMNAYLAWMRISHECVSLMNAYLDMGLRYSCVWPLRNSCVWPLRNSCVWIRLVIHMNTYLSWMHISHECIYRYGNEIFMCITIDVFMCTTIEIFMCMTIEIFMCMTIEIFMCMNASCHTHESVSLMNAYLDMGFRYSCMWPLRYSCVWPFKCSYVWPLGYSYVWPLGYWCVWMRISNTSQMYTKMTHVDVTRDHVWMSHVTCGWVMLHVTHLYVWRKHEWASHSCYTCKQKWVTSHI